MAEAAGPGSDRRFSPEWPELRSSLQGARRRLGLSKPTVSEGCRPAGNPARHPVVQPHFAPARADRCRLQPARSCVHRAVASGEPAAEARRAQIGVPRAALCGWRCRCHSASARNRTGRFRILRVIPGGVGRSASGDSVIDPIGGGFDAVTDCSLAGFVASGAKAVSGAASAGGGVSLSQGAWHAEAIHADLQAHTVIG